MFGAVCFVYTCRRLIDLSLIAGMKWHYGTVQQGRAPQRLLLVCLVSRLLIYQAPACFTGLSSAGMFYWSIKPRHVLLVYQAPACFTGLSSAGMFYWSIKRRHVLLIRDTILTAVQRSTVGRCISARMWCDLVPHSPASLRQSRLMCSPPSSLQHFLCLHSLLISSLSVPVRYPSL